jgi:anaerobic ribonucleoside-triphosphate reductase activating protein
MMKKTLNEEFINLAAFVPETRNLGPGLRAVIWVQGCPFTCPGCIAPEWIPMKADNNIQVSRIVNEIVKSENVTGLTISGGEPFMQPIPLINIVKQVKELKDLDIICFTGFSYDDLLLYPTESPEKRLIDHLDVLIDGPYISNLNNNIGLRGSSNQRIIQLTDRLSKFDLARMPRQIEIKLTSESITIVGIPPQEALKAINKSYDLLNKFVEG